MSAPNVRIAITKARNRRRKNNRKSLICQKDNGAGFANFLLPAIFMGSGALFAGIGFLVWYKFFRTVSSDNTGAAKATVKYYDSKGNVIRTEERNITEV